MSAIIREVLEVKGVWNGSIERDYIRSQQRAPEPPQSFARVYAEHSKRHYQVGATAAVLSALGCGSYASVADLCATTGYQARQVHAVLGALAEDGLIERESPLNLKGVRQRAQRYRLVR